MTPEEIHNMALTDRQQQISDMQKQGMKAPEIAAALSITTNAVYQQLRRMRTGTKTTSAKKTTPKKTGAKSGPKSAGTAAAAASGQPASTPNITASVKPARPLTPLQSLRGRRDEISADIKAAEQERDAAKRALDKAQEAVEKVSSRHKEELDRLDQAEAALTGKPVAGPAKIEPAKTASPKPTGKPASAATPRPKASDAKKSGSKNGGSGSNAAKAPVTPPSPAAAAQAAPQAAPAPSSAPSQPTTQAQREAAADFDPAAKG